jgi:hypothetical protein
LHLAYGGQDRLNKARAALIQARQCDPPAPWWTVAWFNGLVNAQNANFDEAIRHFQQILDPKNGDPVRELDFTMDYIVRNELGKALFWRAQQEEGVDPDAWKKYLKRAVVEFERTLELDAEDVIAHEFLNKCFGRLAADAKLSFAPPTSLTGDESRLVQLSKDAADVAQSMQRRLGSARELCRLAVADKLDARSVVLAGVRQTCASLSAASGDVGLRLLVGQSLAYLDRHLLQSVSALTKQLEDTSVGGGLEAAADLDALLLELASRPTPVDARPLLGFAPFWPTPGLPMNLALDGLATMGYLQGPLPPPRLLVLQAARGPIRRLFDAAADPELRVAAARVLGRIHLVMHGIYKPDENAQDLAVRIYRQRHPAAARASHAIVIYDLR